MRSVVMKITPPLLLVGAIFLVWAYAIDFFTIPDYLFPRLGAVGRSLFRGYIEGAYWIHVAFTLESTLIGYAIGVCLALLGGIMVAEYPILERTVLPVVIAVQSMPKVAIAPLVIVWFGFGIASKIVLVALICFFPVFINITAGLRSVDTELVEMMRAFGVSRGGILLQVKLPHAASAIFAGLQIGIVLALIGAVVGEFISSTKGLGFLIQNASSALDLGTVFAALISLAAIGLLLSQVLQALRRRVVFWERRTTVTQLTE